MSEAVSQNNKRIAVNTIYLYGRLFFILFVSLYTVRVLLKSLGVLDYGIYNVVGGFAAMFGFLSTSMSTAIQRFYNYEMGKNGLEAANKVYNLSLKIQIFLAVIIGVIAEVVGVWYINTYMVIPDERLIAANWVYQFTVISLLLAFIQIPFSSAIMAFERMNFFAIVGVVDAILKLAIAWGISYATYDKLWVYGLLMCLISVVNIVMYIIYCKRNIKTLYFAKYSDKCMSKDILVFSGWNMIGTFAYMARTQGVNVLLNYFFGAIINAATGIVGQISGALQTFTSNIVIAFKPQLTQSYAEGHEKRAQNLWFIMSKVSYVFTLTIAVPLMIEMDYVLHLWLGETVPEYTTEFSVLVVISFLIAAFHTPMVQIIQAVGDMKTFQIVTAIVICSILPISWFCLQMGMGAVSVFWVICAVYVVNHFCAMWLVHRVFPFNYWGYVREILSPCGLVTILLPVIPYVLHSVMSVSFGRLVVVAVVSVAISLALSYLIILGKRERVMIHDFVRKKINR